MATDYFGQKQAEIKAQHQKESETHRLQSEAAARMDREGREHLRDVIIPFFEEARSVGSNNAFLHIEKDQMRGEALPARIQVTLKAANHEGARSGWPILISVSPSLSVMRLVRTGQPGRPGMPPASLKQEQIDVGTRVAADLDHDGLAKLFRMMVDEFFGGR